MINLISIISIMYQVLMFQELYVFNVLLVLWASNEYMIWLIDAYLAKDWRIRTSICRHNALLHYMQNSYKIIPSFKGQTMEHIPYYSSRKFLWWHGAEKTIEVYWCDYWCPMDDHTSIIMHMELLWVGIPREVLTYDAGWLNLVTAACFAYT